MTMIRDKYPLRIFVDETITRLSNISIPVHVLILFLMFSILSYACFLKLPASFRSHFLTIETNVVNFVSPTDSELNFYLLWPIQRTFYFTVVSSSDILVQIFSIILGLGVSLVSRFLLVTTLFYCYCHCYFTVIFQLGHINLNFRFSSPPAPLKMPRPIVFYLGFLLSKVSIMFT